MSINAVRSVNLKRGFRRITLVLAALLAIGCAVYTGYIPVQKRTYYSQFSSSRSPRLCPIVKRPSEQEFREFEEWQKEKGVSIGPEMYSISDDQSLNQTLKDFGPHFLRVIYWQHLSKPGLVELITVYALGGAMVGFLAGWFLLWHVGLAIYRLIRWVVLGFRDSMAKTMDGRTVESGHSIASR